MKQQVYFASVPSYDSPLLEQKIDQYFQEENPNWNSGTKILLKPNLLSKSSPDKAITTHPEVVRGVIRACKNRGIKGENILLADSAGGLYHTKQTMALYQGCGMTAIAKEEGIQLYTDCQWETVATKGKVVSEFTLLKPVREVDYIINLPKFKTHVMTGMTAGCKNMFGCIPGLDKSQWHTRFPQKDPFGEMLMDLYQLIPPNLTLLDGILAMEGDGPGGGTPRSLGILMASEDTLLLDLAVAEMMGYQGATIPYIKAGIDRGLCPPVFDPSYAVGEEALFAPIPNWVLPSSYQGGKEANTTFSQFLPPLLQGLGERVEEALAPKPVIRKQACIGCEKCSEICSKDAISFENRKGFIDKKSCIRCFCCHEVCPVKAIDIKKSGLFRQ